MTEKIPNKKISQKLIQIKKSFNNSTQVPNLLCREEEEKTITNFLKKSYIRLSQKSKKKKIKNLSLFISGLPGTGKSYTVQKSIQKFIQKTNKNPKKYDKKLQIVEMNCMQISDPRSFYQKIFKDLRLQNNTILQQEETEIFYSTDDENMDFEDEMRYLQMKFQKLTTLTPRKITILILDEIDTLSQFRDHQELLYQLFDCASQKNSKSFILLGIANNLEFTDKLLPILFERGANPLTLNFTTYSIDQLSLLIKQRISPIENYEEVFHPQAIELCSRKISKTTGDIRKAFDLCRECANYAIKQKLNCVTFQVMFAMINQLVDPKKSNLIDSLPLQQKIVLASIVLLSKNPNLIFQSEQIPFDSNRKKTKKPKKVEHNLNVNILRNYYISFCKLKKIDSISRQSFIELLDKLEGSGMIKLTQQKKKKSNIWLNKIDLITELDELEFCFSKIPFLEDEFNSNLK
ncbi:cell division control protein [Anaeramoeba ignava]|uniref:Cell division control protein n=1 Tax=Anaeramoeba ignava TaxID=1746090 RepID=A0A9Q0RHC5_ANAIG|nr:cell division control protein [Anaeramoeba ignava]